jgi:hypothetical protein
VVNHPPYRSSYDYQSFDSATGVRIVHLSGRGRRLAEKVAIENESAEKAIVGFIHVL